MKDTEVPNPRCSSVIVLVCWLESIILSWLSHACHAHCFVLIYMQSSLAGFWRSFTGLVQLVFSFPSWFHTIWLYCCHTFHSFLSQITLCFTFGSKEMITAFTCLPSYIGTAALYCGLALFEACLLPMCNNQRTSKERLSQEQNGR